MDEKHYNTVFHLVGEEKVPNLLGVMQLKADKHIFIKSKDYSSSYIKKVLNGAEYEEILIEPFEINDVMNKIENFLQNKSINSEGVAFNLTGGTKMMFIGAYLVCNDIGADAFYFDTYNKRMLSLNDDTSTEIIRIKNVKTFMDLGSENYYISSSGYTSLNHNRISIAKKIMNNIKDAKLINDEYKAYTVNREKLTFHDDRYYGKIYIKLNNPTNFKIKIDNIEYTYRDINFAYYIDGGWFEDYVFNILQQYQKQNKIYDLHSGMIVSSVETNVKIQEFDIIFTDGLRLFIIELKSGKNFDSKDINKIKNITNNFGGKYAQPIFISIVNNCGLEKRAEFDRVPYIQGRDFEQQLIKYLDENLAYK